MFQSVELAPRDPIIGLTEAFAADSRPTKVNLGVGVYCDDNGKIPMLRAVREAEKARVEAGVPRGYLPIEGLAAYDAAVQKMLFGADSPLIERTSFVFDSMLRLSYFLGNYYPVGGSQVFADDLARRFEALGGQLCLRTLGLKILTKDGKAYGVEVETGLRTRRTRHTVLADRIISNGDLLRTYEEMLGPQDVAPAYVAELRKLRPSMPCFLAHIGLRDVSRELLERVSGYYWDSWESDAVGQSALRFKIFAPTLFEPRMAPPGGQVVIIQRALPPATEHSPCRP